MKIMLDIFVYQSYTLIMMIEIQNKKLEGTMKKYSVEWKEAAKVWAQQDLRRHGWTVHYIQYGTEYRHSPSYKTKEEAEMQVLNIRTQMSLEA